MTTVTIAPRRNIALLVGLVALELAALVVGYQVMTDFSCGASGALALCWFLNSLVARTLTMMAALALIIWARPVAFRRFLEDAAVPTRGIWPALHVGGVALLFLPLTFAGGADDAAFFRMALVAWLPGAVAASVGALVWLAPRGAWRRLLVAEWRILAPMLALAFVLPDAKSLAGPLWNVTTLTEATFHCVYYLLTFFSADTYASVDEYIIGVEDFSVFIASACSGVEGLVLVSAFTLIYAVLFRDTVHQGRFWLVVLPLGLLFSWLFNVVRIATLILIGARISPTIAVEGFHSYAGWMFFTLLALGILFAVQATPWLHRAPTVPRPAAPGLREDDAAGLILPFVAFMVASLVAAAFFAPADLGYPIKAAAMLGALVFFSPVYRRLDWRIDPVAVAAGVAVGLAWVLTETADPDRAALYRETLAALGPTLLMIWVGVRIAGAVLLVPMVEELFFRGYLMTRLDVGGRAPRIAAVGISSVAFALLHGRWIEAGVAGVVFALVMLRRGRVSDAVVAHVAANAMVALWAAIEGDFSRM